MLSLEEYLQDPCGKLSIPFWKAKIYPVPKDMMVVHTRDLSHINMDNRPKIFSSVSLYGKDRIFRPARL